MCSDIRYTDSRHTRGGGGEGGVQQSTLEPSLVVSVQGLEARESVRQQQWRSLFTSPRVGRRKM